MNKDDRLLNAGWNWEEDVNDKEWWTREGDPKRYSFEEAYQLEFGTRP